MPVRMRVIAGSLGGRWFEAPDGHQTHPMGERIRGALFNILGDMSGLTVLDAFAGSGALAFEALSRGAERAVLLERDKKAIGLLRANVQKLGLEAQVQVIQANCRAWSEQNQAVTFDLLFCDPPYHDLQLSTVSLLVRHLNPNGLMILSHPGRGASPTVNGVVVVDNRNYGDAALTFYRLEESSE